MQSVKSRFKGQRECQKSNSPSIKSRWSFTTFLTFWLVQSSQVIFHNDLTPWLALNFCSHWVPWPKFKVKCFITFNRRDRYRYRYRGIGNDVRYQGPGPATKCCAASFAAKSNPLPFYIPFLTGKGMVPSVYLLLINCTPFKNLA